MTRDWKHQEKATTRLRDLYSHGRHFGLTSKELEARYASVIFAMPARTPNYVKAFLRGYWKALIDRAYELDLVYGGYIDGQFYSTHRARSDYYESNGIEPREFAQTGKVQNAGHYWAENLKPFFIGETGEQA